MKRIYHLLLVLVTGAPATAAGADAVDYLISVTDQHHTQLAVYTDGGAAGNHFLARGRMSSSGDEQAVPPMDEYCSKQPRSGATCIKCRFESRGTNWGGWYFMNGVLRKGEVEPLPNWGALPAGAMDLRGATSLTFYVRGQRGGEIVEFFALGVGRDPFGGTPVVPFPGSARKVSTGRVVLTKDWQKMTLRLQGDLSRVLGGFGWVTNSPMNVGKSITFFIDDAAVDKPLLDQPRLPTSYETHYVGTDFDKVLKQTAFTYDAALTLIAFLSSNQPGHARQIADALVYAQKNDRFYSDGRLRNAYAAGPLTLPPGWQPNGKGGAVRLPGWYDAAMEKWLEDEYQVSSSTGPIAWAMIALLAYHDLHGGQEYVDAAMRLGQWLEEHCYDRRGAGGFTAGYHGWETRAQKAPAQVNRRTPRCLRGDGAARAQQWRFQVAP